MQNRRFHSYPAEYRLGWNKLVSKPVIFSLSNAKKNLPTENRIREAIRVDKYLLDSFCNTYTALKKQFVMSHGELMACDSNWFK